ncbi:hypothetical protein [Sphingobacterium micropteri]|nr:hypothetical protein [Sphingobacterium micropteri]
MVTNVLLAIILHIQDRLLGMEQSGLGKRGTDLPNGDHRRSH